MQIESLQNPLAKLAVKLRDKRKRDQYNQFVIEGYRELLRACEAVFFVETVLVCEDFFLKNNEMTLIKRLEKAGSRIIKCHSRVFEKISYRDRPDGLFGITNKPSNSLEEMSKKWNDLDVLRLVVAQSIEKPGNLGTILRSADASGCHGVIVCDSCTDVYNPNVVRASIGTLFTVDVVETTSEKLLPWLEAQGIQLVATTPDTEAIYTEVTYNQRIAIAVGAEQYGLTSQWLEKAQQCVKIPMCGRADSLNVAMATTLMLYEIFRQSSNSSK